MQLDRVCEQLTVAQMANGERCHHLLEGTASQQRRLSFCHCLEGNGQSAEVPLFQSSFWRETSIFSSFWRETASLQKWPPFCNFWREMASQQKCCSFSRLFGGKHPFSYLFGGKWPVYRSGHHFVIFGGKRPVGRSGRHFVIFWREMASQQKCRSFSRLFGGKHPFSYLFGGKWPVYRSGHHFVIFWRETANVQSAERGHHFLNFLEGNVHFLFFLEGNVQSAERGHHFLNFLEENIHFLIFLLGNVQVAEVAAIL